VPADAFACQASRLPAVCVQLKRYAYLSPGRIFDRHKYDSTQLFNVSGAYDFLVYKGRTAFFPSFFSRHCRIGCMLACLVR
jgi:hypothetical protein